MLKRSNKDSINKIDRKVRVYRDKEFTVEVTDNNVEGEWCREIIIEPINWWLNILVSYDEDGLYISYDDKKVTIDDLKKEIETINNLIKVIEEVQDRFINIKE